MHIFDVCIYIYIYYIPLPSSDAHPSKKLLLFNISKCGTIQAAVKTVDGQILGKCRWYA